MRVLLDTNVLVSAFTTRGLCADLFLRVLAEHELLCAEVVLEELDRVLTDRFRVPAIAVNDILVLLRNFEIVPKPAKPPAIKVRDADDARVLA